MQPYQQIDEPEPEADSPTHGPLVEGDIVDRGRTETVWMNEWMNEWMKEGRKEGRNVFIFCTLLLSECVTYMYSSS
jgi:hypothetical protein